MAETRTFGDLYKAKAITDEDLVAAVDAFMADRSTAEFAIGNEYVLNLSAAIQASHFAVLMLNDSAFKAQRSAYGDLAGPGRKSTERRADDTR